MGNYTKTAWVNGSAPAISAANLDKIETALKTSYDALGGNDGTGNPYLAGVTFPAAQIASADPNTLDDYEEGEWTPIYLPASGAFGAITYVANGTYQKIGNVVHIRCFLRTDALAIGTASGNLLVGGLPFTSANIIGALSVPFSSTFAGEAPNGSVYFSLATAAILYYKNASNGASLASQCSDLTTGAVSAANYLIMVGSYFV